MRWFLSQKRRSVFYRYLLSFICILIVPLILLGTLLYRNSVVMLENDLKALEKRELLNIRTLVDNEISELEKIALRISFDSSLNQHVLRESEYNAYLAAPLLKTHSSSSKLSPEVFLHFRDSNVLYSSSGKLRISTLMDYIYYFTDSQKKEFLETLWGVEQPMVLGKESKQIVTFLYPIPSLDRKPHTIVFFSISEAQLTTCLKRAASDNGSNLYIMDENYNEIVSLQGEQPLAVTKARSLLSSTSDISSGDNVLDKSMYFTVQAKSTDREWTYISITPINHMLEGVRRARRQSLFIILCVTFGGIALATVLSRFNYRPIRELLRKSRKYLSSSNSSFRKNEIAEIEDWIDYTSKENRILVERINAQKPLIKDQILLSLLRGDPSDNETLLELCRLGSIDIEDSNFRVMVFSFNYRERRKTTFKKISIVLSDVLRTALKPRYYHVIELMHDEIALILCSRQIQFDRSFSAHIANDVLAALCNKLDIKSTVGVSKLYSDVSRMKDSYLDALAAISGTLLKETGRVVFFEDVLSLEHARYWYPMEELARMVQSLKQGSMISFKDVLDTIIKNVRDRKFSSSMRRSICYGIVNTFINTVNDMNIDSIDGLDEKIEALTKFESLEHLKSLLVLTAEQICIYIDRQRHSANEELKSMIMTYVREQYKNRMINLDILADHFGFSVGYMSRTFKAITGSGFAEFIKQLRVDEAKRLLKETHISVKSVVKDIGYSDVSNFTRTFRIMEGVTPSQYRDLYCINRLKA